jgi:chaperone BCS1
MIDVIFTIIISSIIMTILQSNFHRKINKIFDSLWKRLIKKNMLIFTITEKNYSKRFKAIMYYISKKDDPSIRTLSEIFETKYNAREEEYLENTKLGVYKIDQPMEFNVDKNIKGKVYMKEKQTFEYNGRTNYADITVLEIYSKNLKLIELEKWVEKKLEEYETYLKAKSCDKQLLVEISWDPKEKEIETYKSIWESNANFQNRFFTNKEQILDKINFFIKNPEWYKKRGIPYTLGFLLWGEPGCGKTGFIKALMNLTGRHGISIKLNNRFDMNKLREIIFDENIDDETLIPPENRILIFEDIDCMGTIVKDRDLNDQKEDEKNKEKKKDTDLVSILENYDNYNNNLSFFLNILDGLQECPGRIIIMTTNKPEILDKALIRPGRIDFNIHFTKATINDIKNILNFYWELNEDISIDEACNMKYSHAEIVNFCRISSSLQETIQKLIK